MSKTIILDLLRDKMRADLDDPNIPLKDPKKETRGDKAPFILTSYPTTNVYFPHVIIGELTYSGNRLDAREDLFQGNFSVRISIHADTNTHLFQIKDAVRDWLQRNVTYLNRQGFTELQFDGSSPMDFDFTATVKQYEIILKGKVYTTTEE